MNEQQFAELLSGAAADVDVKIPAGALDRLAAYWKLLVKWNAAMNLTALSLDPPSAAALSRLFLEPAIAASHFPDRADRWYDLGSGGGSPAIPLKILRPQLPLVMVEAKARKSTFLREVVGSLSLSDVKIWTERLESVGAREQRSADLVSVRAVRPDERFCAAVAQLLKPSGRLVSFQPLGKPLQLQPLERQSEVRLGSLGDARLVWYVPRGTSTVDR